MKNRELFQRDPALAKLMNDGVAAVTEATTDKEVETLRYELEHFVCEGQYKDGLVRIVESYLANISAPFQPAAWVSGFFGSGKSHLLKMLRHLWANTVFPSDGATARGLAHLPQDVKTLLRELDTLGTRCGGLVAVSDKLPGGGGVSLRKAILGIVFQSRGLPSEIAQAEFCMWLQKNGMFDAVKDAVTKQGKDFHAELPELYASPLLANAILNVDPSFAKDLKSARDVLRTQFRDRSDVSTEEFLRFMRLVLSTKNQLPCTLIALDEVQLFIGENAQSSYDVQLIVEALCKQMDSRILVVASGQTALAGSIPMLQRLRDRFTINVALSDSDVETVTRRVVLAKKADKRKVIEDMLDSHAGEIDRQLSGTRIGPRAEDRKFKVDDYPLLPVRRRFWEHCLKEADIPGTASQLRTQLRMVHDAVRELADKPIGTVLGADRIFEYLEAGMVQSQFLLRELDDRIRALADGTPDGQLAKRMCGLIFFIRKFKRDSGLDIGVRATADMLADLLIEDLGNEGTSLRQDIPRVLDKLVSEGVLIKLDDEYSLQTRESSEWDREFRNRHTRLSGNLSAINNKQATLLSAQCNYVMGELKLTHGASRTARVFRIHYSNEAPKLEGQEIPIWIRDGWGESEGTVLSDARAAGSDSAMIFVYIPKVSAEELKKSILEYEGAKATVEFKGTPTTPEGIEARDAMTTRMKTAEGTRDRIIRDVINAAKVFKGGGNEVIAIDLVEKVRSAAEDSLDRLFPRFKDGDDHRWSSVINRSKNNDANALMAVDWKDSPEKHPVCSAILAEVGAGKRGKEIRDKFENNPYGWPRDAVDGAIMTLHATGHLRAVHKGSVLSVGQLDQAKVSVTDFRAETATIDAKGRIKLRKLFQAADVACKPNEEAAAAGAFLAKMYELARSAGGDAPLPLRPATTGLDELRSLAGNEQLAGILKEYAALEKALSEWKSLTDLASKRTPAWETLSTFLGHASILPQAAELQQNANVILSERRLLDETDPVPDIHHDVVKALRIAVKAAHGQFETVYNHEMDSLSSSENWKALDEGQQRQILIESGIDGLQTLAIGDDVALQRSLAVTGLGAWRTKTEALPQQFRNAAVAAAKLLEPKTQSVRLTSQTLKTPDEIKAWLAETEKDLIHKLKKGPIVIS